MALSRPLPGGIKTQPFGPSHMDIQPSMYYRGTEKAYWSPFPGQSGFSPNVHAGVDYAGKPAGTRLIAAEAGTVVRSTYDSVNGGGNVVEVEIRPGVRYSYNHCQSRLVGLNAKVTKGQAIATVGATGTILLSNGTRVRSTYGVHCHTVMTVAEKGSDGITRTMLHDFEDFCSGGSRATSSLIKPTSTAPQRIYIGSGINIRRSPTTNSGIARTTRIAGNYNSPYPYIVNGQYLTSGTVRSDDWRTVSLDGVTCYVWAPLSRKV